MRIKRVLWAIFGLVLLVVAAGFAVPHFAADRFGAGAQKALETSLGRKVQIGEVKYNLFTGPGFTISKVVIYDDPKLSAEPIIYAETLTAIPRILPLFTGRLAFSSIRLEDAHINLGRTASPEQPAQWNVGALTRPALFQAFPHISVVSGGVTGLIPKSRINFKIGGIKAPFYILIDKLEVSPPSVENGPWSLRMEGEPARTDRPALGFGSFVADGRWEPATGLADVTVRMDRSEISDMISLLNGHDAGIHGSMSGTARITGHLSALKINGQVDVSGIHGFDQMASTGQHWPLAIAGMWNLPGQFFELSSRLAADPNPPVQAHFRVADYLGAPHWGLTVTCQAMPLQPLLPLARQIGLAIPDGVQLNGLLDGGVGFSRDGSSEGSARIVKASLLVRGAPPVEFEDANLIVAEGHARLAPAAFRTAGVAKEAVENAASENTFSDNTLDGDYDLNQRSLKVTLTSRGMDVAALRKHAEVLGVPMLRDLQSGNWKGQVAYSFDPAAGAKGTWIGAVDVQRAVIELPNFATPVKVATAHADLDATSLVVRKIQARAGDLAVTGEYRYELGAIRPHRFHLVAGRVSGAQLEALFRPALYRGGLVSRALGLKRSEVPDWLLQMRADGTLEIGTLDFGGYDFDHFSARLIWDGARLKLADSKAHYGASSVTGLLEADLAGQAPVYHGAGNVVGMPWKGGKLTADMAMDTSGSGAETLSNLRAEGSFMARDVAGEYPSMDGCFLFNWGGKSPKIKLSSLQLSDGDETYVGSGATSANGELVLDLAGVEKPVRLTLR